MKNFSRFREVLPKFKGHPSLKNAQKSFVIALFLFSLFLPRGVLAQSKEINLDFKNTSLEVIFKRITSQSGYTFFFNNDVDAGQKVNVSYKGVSIDHAMKAVLAGTSVDFKVQGNRIVLFAKKGKQQERVQIKVLGSQKETLPGATITVDGRPGGAMTDANGMASLFFTDKEPKTIKVSFVGMLPGVLTWKGESDLVCTLQYDSKQIEEVIVTGFGNISKERSTGSVTVLNSTELEKKVSFDLTSSLEGKVAGLNTYGDNFAIRGTTSFKSVSSPLVVVDGLPIEGTLSDVNPLDVESVTVLKDAASASIYGVRAANGIIVVTTKSGKKGKTVVDFSMNYSMTPQSRISDYRYASTADIIDYERYYLEHDPTYFKNPKLYFDSRDDSQTSYSLVYKAYRDCLNGLITEDQKEAQIANLKKYDYRKEYERLIWRNSVTQQYNLAVRKGSEKMETALSVTYKKQQFNTINNDGNDITINFKNKLDIISWLSLTWGVYGNFSKKHEGLGGGTATGYKPYNRILDDNGNRSQQLTGVNYYHNEGLKANPGLFGMEYNPLDEMESSFKNSNMQRFRAFTEMDIKLYKGLTYNLKFQYQKDNSKVESTYLKTSNAMRETINKFAVVNDDKSITYNIPVGGRLYTATADNYNYTVRNQLNYNTSVLDKFAVTLFAGTEFSEYNTTNIYSDLYGYDPEIAISGSSLINWTLLQSTGVTGALSPRSRQYLSPIQGAGYKLDRNFSLYFNGSVSYEGKYVLAGSWRVDQTNLFGVAERNKFRPLWSVSGSWNASEEAFLKDISWLNMLKLRTSLGLNGNVDRTTSPYLLARVGNAVDVPGSYAYITAPPNPDLRWEKTEIFNVGLDFRLFRKLSGSLDYYYKYTTDLLATASIDPSTGFTAARYNNGKMLNRGVEVSLNYNWLNNKDWDISTGFVLAYNKNEVKSIDLTVPNASALISSPTSYYRVGDPYNSLYAYRYAGITDTGDPSVYDAKGNVIVNAVLSDPNALVYMGSYNPPVTGSLSQSIRYKGFSLEALLVLYAGHKLRLDAVSISGSATASMKDGINDRWTEDNKTSEIPRFPVYSGGGDRRLFWQYGDNQVASASMVKLRNLGLGYSLRGGILDKLKMQSIQVKAQINNLWYWSACGNGIDPENYNAKDGERNGANKPTYILGVNLTF